jgi:branched-chain amino acid transport system permease protein
VIDVDILTTLLQALIAGLSVGSLYGLIALGYSLTFVVNGTVNMSQGQMVMVGAMLMLTFVKFLHIPFFIALPMSGLLVGLLGIFLERVAIRKFAQESTSVSWILSTLAIGIILQDVGQFVWGPEEHLLSSPVGNGMVRIMGAGVYWKELMLIPAVIICLVLLSLFYLKSHWGLWLRAAADNRRATNLMGINSNYIVAIAFGLSGILAGLAGGMLSPIYAISVSMGLGLGLKAIAVAIVGGLNSAKGIVITGICLGMAEVLVSLYISTEVREMIIYLIVIVILFFKPTGIFGKRAVVKV